MREVKEILGEQLELLAEASKKQDVTTDELCRLTTAMVAIGNIVAEPYSAKP